MRVLCLTDAFWPDQAGGISKAVWFETQQLVRMGRELVAVSRRLTRDAAAREAREGYELHRFQAPPINSALGSAYPLATMLNLPRVLRQLHASTPFDVAYVNNVFQARALLQSGIGIPMVYVFHASAYREVSIDIRNGRYGKLKLLARLANEAVRPIERLVLDRADAIVVRSTYMAGEIESLYGSARSMKVRRIPLGIDTEKFSFAGEVRTARQQLGLPENRRIILTVRRLVARMGLDNLIRAMDRVAKRFPDALLLIGGAGYLESSLRESIRSLGLGDQVAMLGFVSEELLPLYYQAADLFVLPTQEYEGFGMSTLEALSSGTPAIVTPVGANPEVVAPLDRRLVAEGATVVAIADAVVRWFEQSEKSVSRKSCRDYCVNNFALASVCDQIDSLFVELAGAAGPLQRHGAAACQ